MYLLDHISPETPKSGPPWAGRESLVSVLEFGIQRRLGLFRLGLVVGGIFGLVLGVVLGLVFGAGLVLLLGVSVLLQIIVCKIHAGDKTGAGNRIGW